MTNNTYGRFENLTGHTVTILHTDGKIAKRIGVSGRFAPLRLKTYYKDLGKIHGVPVNTIGYGLETPLSELRRLEKLDIIVSLVTAKELHRLGYQGRMFVPCGKQIGQYGVKGCTALSLYKR